MVLAALVIPASRKRMQDTAASGGQSAGHAWPPPPMDSSRGAHRMRSTGPRLGEFVLRARVGLREGPLRPTRILSRAEVGEALPEEPLSPESSEKETAYASVGEEGESSPEQSERSLELVESFMLSHEPTRPTKEVLDPGERTTLCSRRASPGECSDTSATTQVVSSRRPPAVLISCEARRGGDGVQIDRGLCRGASPKET